MSEKKEPLTTTEGSFVIHERRENLNRAQRRAVRYGKVLQGGAGKIVRPYLRSKEMR
jgi:hypothetical protein